MTFFRSLSQEQRDSELLKACRNGQERRINLLLHAGANPNVQIYGTSPVHEASKHPRNALKCVKQFEDVAANLDEKDSEGATPLYLAVIQGNTALVRYFLENDANVQKSTCMQPMLIRAAVYGMFQIVEALLDSGAQKDDCDPRGMTALIQAVVYGHLRVFDLLISRGCDPFIYNNQGWSVIHYCAMYNREDILVALHARLGTDFRDFEPDEFSRPPIHTAVESGHPHIVSRLLQFGLDPNGKGKMDKTALQKAIELGQEECALTIIKFGVDLEVTSDTGFTALHDAATEGEKDVLVAILEANHRSQFLEMESKGGNTALTQAVMNSRPACVSELLARGADCDRRTGGGLSARELAKQLEDEEILRVFASRAPPKNYFSLNTGSEVEPVPNGN